MSGYADLSRTAYISPNDLMNSTRVNYYPQELQLANQNALLTNQHNQQLIGSQDTEMAARIAQSLVATGDEAKAAQMYPGMIAEAQGRGFLKNAPTVWPGMERARVVAGLGTSSEKLGERQGVAQQGADFRNRLGGDGTAPGSGGPAMAPAGGGGGGVATGEIEPPARERALAIRDGLVRRGMDVETATGFAANALHESAANPNTGAGDRGASHGVFQWTADRYNAYIAKNGHPPDNAPLDEQLDFVMHELNGSESLAKGRIAQAQGVDGKAAEISNAYLRPKDTGPEMQRRAATALKLAGGWSQPVTAPQSDQAWLANQALSYPALAGPNINMQAGTQPPGAPAGSGGTQAPYQVASLAPVPPPGATAAATALPAAEATKQAQATGQPVEIAGGNGLWALPNGGVTSQPPARPTQPPAATTQQQPPPPAPRPAEMPPELRTPTSGGAAYLTPQDVTEFLDRSRRATTTAQHAAIDADVEQRRAFNIGRQNDWRTQEHTAQTEAATADERAYRRQQDVIKAEADKREEARKIHTAELQDQQAAIPTLTRLAPKIEDGSAKPEERRLYSALMTDTFLKPRTEWVDDPKNPGTKIPNTIPGALPPGFPAPDYQPGQTTADTKPPPSKTTAQPQTDTQAKAAGFLLRMQEEERQLATLIAPKAAGGKGYSESNIIDQIADHTPFVGNYLMTNAGQQYMSRAMEWTRAKLRYESGAAIGDAEAAKEVRTYFPIPGDSKEEIGNKRRRREVAIEALRLASGAAAKGTDAASERLSTERAAPASTAAHPPPPPGFKVIQ